MRVIVVLILLFGTGYAFGQSTCTALTKAGNPCKNKVSEAFGLCKTHQLVYGGNGAPKNYCAGITAAGKPCRNAVAQGFSYCRAHGSGSVKQPKEPGSFGVSGQCAGTTKSGARCKRMTKSVYCYQHGG
jgi:hypothetical protein